MQNYSTGLKDIADEMPSGRSGTKLYRHLADTVIRFIEDRRLMHGARLPPLDRMAKDLGVSRLSIREVLIALEAQNIVQMVRGVGTMVGPAGGNLDKASQEQAIALFEARRLLEGQVAVDAARNASDAGLTMLKASLAALEAGVSSDVYESLRMFHIELAGLTGNNAVRAVVANLWPEASGLSGGGGLGAQAASANARAWAAAHRLIFRAVAKRDGKGAHCAMNAFGDQALSDLFGWLERRDTDRVRQRLARHRKAFSRRTGPH